MLNQEAALRAVRAALEEDLGGGDITSAAVIAEGTGARGRIVARQPLVVAGLPVARLVFLEVDPAVVFRESGAEGSERRGGEEIATVAGPARAILAAERTALNFLQRMSGIATTTRRLTRLALGHAVQIADTRKTAPGLRAIDKYAVHVGGGTNHRAGLSDGVLIKDNHWRLAGGITEAIRRARRALPAGIAAREIEVEVGSVAEAEEAIAAGAGMLLLDNMDRATLERAVAAARGRAFLEVSGGVREEDLPTILALGVDRVSMGALTHSVRAADIALEIEAT